MKIDIRSALNDRQKSALRWLACKIGGRLDRRALIEQTGLSQADCEYLIHVLNQQGGLKVIPDTTNVTSGMVEIQPRVQHLAEQLDSAFYVWQPDSERQQSPATMDILISWSKNKSRQLARELHKWLPNVLPGVKPWMSEKDIDKGTEWFGELQAYLGQAKACIIVITEENVRSSWLYYEAGAIAVKGPDVRVCPYLIGVDPGMLADGPLGKFQCTIPTKDDTLALIYSLNKRLGSPHNEQLLKHAFDVNWPTLEAELGRVRGIPTQNAADFIRMPADELAGIALSPEARTLLIEASQDNQGAVMLDNRELAGTTVGTNGKTLNEQGNPRSEATWTQAVNDLVGHGLLEVRGNYHGMTDKGYKVADKLKDALRPGKELDENDIISLVEGSLASQRDKLASMTFRFDEMETQLGLPSGSAEKFIDKAAETVGHKVRRKGNNTVTFDKDVKRRSLAEIAAEAQQRRVYRG